MQCSAHDPSQYVEAGGVLGGVLLSGVHHQTAVPVAGHHVVVPLSVVGPAVDLVNLRLK